MKFVLLIGHKTHKGPMFIGRSGDGRYHPIWRDESLGSYHNIVGAVEDVAGGHVFTPSDGTDTGALGLSSEPADWLPAKELMQACSRSARTVAVARLSARRMQPPPG